METFALTLLLCGLWLSRVHGDKAVIYKFPIKGVKWSWTTRGSSWEEPTGLAGGTKSYTICSAPGAVSTPDNWLIWQAVTVPQNVRSLDLDITVAVQKCSSIPGGPHAHCKHSFAVYQHEFDDILNPTPPKNNEFVNKIKTLTVSESDLSIIKPGSSKSRVSLTIKTTVQKRGVYFALHDSGMCMSIFSAAVSYRVCSVKPENFVKFEETYPPSDNSTRIKVDGACVDNAVTMGVSELYAFCDSSGNWNLGPGVGCKCSPGYQPDNGSCEACSSALNTYKNLAGNIPCVKCPAHSTQVADRTRCECDKSSGYFSTYMYGENDTYNCTAIPSSPHELKSTFRNDTSIILTWKRPLNTGGRNDLHYRVECFKCAKERSCLLKCKTKTKFQPQQRGLTSLAVTVSKLEPYAQYKFKVFSNNGVTGQAQKENSAELYVSTDESVPGSPEVTVKRSPESTSAHLEWTLEQKNGKILYYTVVYYRVGNPGSARTRNTTYMNITLTGLDPDSIYIFKVKAATSRGYGPSSTATHEIKKQDFFQEHMPYIIGGVAAVVFILIIIIIVVVCRRRKDQNGLQHLDKEGHELLPMDGQRLYIDPSNYGDVLEALKTFTKEIDKDSVKPEKLIGGGEFGEVYKGALTLEDGRTEIVAVKTLKACASRKNRDDFLSEASILGQFNHPNVVQLKGVVTKTLPLMIVLEFMESGSLDHFLQDHDGKLTKLQLLGMARGVAAGMTYLSDMNFIHRDLAARNVLVSDSMACKVADFGLSRELEEDNPESEYQTQGGKIPVRWTAPEAIRYKKFSAASDVWSYGVLLWEILSFAERPYWDWTNFEVMDRVDAGFRLPMPMNCPKIIHDLMLHCWEKERIKRPKFAEIVKRLDELIRSPDKLMDYVTTPRTVTDFDALHTVPDWLDTINMTKYTDQFTSAGYEKLEHVCKITDRDLDRIGVKLIGHRNKISKSIRSMKDHYRKKRDSFV